MSDNSIEYTAPVLGSRADVYRQAIVGLRFGREGLVRAEAEAQLVAQVNRLMEQFGDFNLVPVSIFLAPSVAERVREATAVLQVRSGSVLELLAQPMPDYVEYWEQNSIVRMCADWNDEYYGSQWGLRKIGALAEWTTTVVEPVTVAIVDSGVMWQWSGDRVVGAHPDLDGRTGGEPFPHGFGVRWRIRQWTGGTMTQAMRSTISMAPVLLAGLRTDGSVMKTGTVHCWPGSSSRFRAI